MMPRKTLSLFIAMVVLFVPFSTTAFADSATSEMVVQTIAPRWNNIDRISPGISGSGTKVYYDATIIAKSSSSSITGTLHLEKYSGGKWTSAAKTNIRGTGDADVEGSFTGVKGTQYRTKVVVSVAGESATVYSGSYTL